MDKWRKSTKNIIFDLDGTLWDPLEMSVKAWHKALGDNPCIQAPITEEEIKGILGMQHNLVGASLFPYLTEVQQQVVMQSCYAAEVERIKAFGAILYPQLEETLAYLVRNYQLYIVSNCQAGYIEAFYEYHGLESYFLDCECSGNTGKSKAENIEMLLKRNNLENAIYIGDTQGDYEAALANELPFVFAEYGFGQVPEAHYILKNIAGLKKLL
ncbi:HAD family hydrolase [Arenibacter amylolyticus]|uniref:HAD family hydrolase n=1 Tax=Arenibacter amylolyticus TaxID=1406873 RepID=UPI000A370376|nr:HAD family hydrolase [Arenibacter amylolyticus]